MTRGKWQVAAAFCASGAALVLSACGEDSLFHASPGVLERVDISQSLLLARIDAWDPVQNFGGRPAFWYIDSGQGYVAVHQ